MVSLLPNEPPLTTDAVPAGLWPVLQTQRWVILTTLAWLPLYGFPPRSGPTALLLCIVGALLWLTNEGLLAWLRRRPAGTPLPPAMMQSLWAVPVGAWLLGAGALAWAAWYQLPQTAGLAIALIIQPACWALLDAPKWSLLTLLVGGGLLWRLTSPATLLALGPAFLLSVPLGRLLGESLRRSSVQVNRLQSLAATDGLTGLMNRRQFNQQLRSEMARARRHFSHLSLALFDIDNFKQLNDHYGHPTGDQVLRELGALLKANVRENDLAARYGGEEFALILPETKLAEAKELLERLRTLVERTVFCLPDSPITLTLSIGVAQLDADQPNPTDLVAQTDEALYEAKRQGKNRVVVAPSTPGMGLRR